MDTRLLKMFCSVAERGSLVEAARQLHLTPSAISHGLKSLETQVGCRLFDRAGKRVILNQAGEHLLAQVKQPLAALDEAAASLKRLGQWGQTRLRIGAAASTCQHIVPPVVRELKKNFPTLTLQVESGDMPETISLVLQGRVDLALGVAPENQTGLDVRPVFKDELLFTFAPTHPWASARSLSRDDLRKESLILYQRSSFTARLVNDYFRRTKQYDRIIIEGARVIDQKLSITDKDIEEAVLEGAVDLDGVQKKLKVGIGSPEIITEVEQLIRFYKEKYYG